MVKRDKNGRFQKGTTGNPSGRPPEGRAFTEILRARGEHPSLYPPHSKRYRLESREVLAAQLWEAVMQGKVSLADGTQLSVKNADDWFNIAKWLYQQIDGPPKLQADINQQQDGEVTVRFVNPYLGVGEEDDEQ